MLDRQRRLGHRHSALTEGTAHAAPASTAHPGHQHRAPAQRRRTPTTTRPTSSPAHPDPGGLQPRRRRGVITTDNAPAGWQNAPVTVTLTPVTYYTGATIASTYLQCLRAQRHAAAHHGTSVLIPAAADGSNDGSHIITYYSTDSAGHTEASHSVTVQIDAAGPTVATDAAAGWHEQPRGALHGPPTWVPAQAPPPSPTRWTAAAGPPALSYAESFVTWTWHRVYSATLPEGIHTLYSQANDVAGNVGPVNTQTVMVDTVAPTLTVTSPTEGGFYVSGLWALDYTTSDATSGINAAAEVITLDGNPATATQVANAGAGAHTLVITEYDNAGNSTTVTRHFNVFGSLTMLMSAPASPATFTQGDSTTVSWSISGAVSTGSFRLWLKNTSTNAWVRVTPLASPIAPVAGQTSYSVPWNVSQPAGSYKLWVYYYGADGTVKATVVSSGAITILQKATPTIISPNSGSFFRGTSMTVSWSMSSPVSAGSFRVWLKDTTSNTWVRLTPAASPVAAVPGATSYVMPWFITQPASTYKLWVYYYAPDGSVSSTASSSGTITLS